MIKKNLRKYCKLAGTSQAALARNMGMSRQRLSRRMNDPYMLSIGLLEDMSALLGCSVGDLMGQQAMVISRTVSDVNISIGDLVEDGVAADECELGCIIKTVECRHRGGEHD